MKKSQLKSLSELVLGTFILALSVNYFIIPSGISAGGATGIATVLAQIFDWDVVIIVWTINISLLLITGIFIGKDVVMKSIVGSILFPLFLTILPRYSAAGDDVLLAMIIGGMLTGVASYFIFTSGGSTGGTSLPPFILRKYFNIPLVTGLTIFDTISVGANILTGNIPAIFYGMIAILMTKLVADYLEVGIKRRKALYIISEVEADILTYIHEEIGRGTTKIEAYGGFSSQNRPIILTIVSIRELHLIREKVLMLDEKAFLFIASVSEVHGEGFTRMRAVRPLKELETLEAMHNI
ncbi:UPF0750 membrane protein YvjA [Erysipelotrichaceae bacterium]|nr:UPF0750 membrane protein YvjA [Erysipelotrichaceae bacterium]